MEENQKAIADQPATPMPPAVPLMPAEVSVASALPTWLERFAGHRRGSCGFSSDNQLGVSPANYEENKSVLTIPKIKFNIGLVSSSPMDANPNMDAGIFSFQEHDNTVKGFLEKYDTSATATTTPATELTKVSNVVDIETFPVASLDTIVEKKDADDMFDLDLDSKAAEEPSKALDLSKVVPDEDFEDKKQGKLVHLLVNSGLTKNWFFENSDAPKEEPERSMVDATEEANMLLRGRRELNMWSPQMS